MSESNESTFSFEVMTPTTVNIPRRTAAEPMLPSTPTLAIIGHDGKQFRALLVNMEDLNVHSVVEGSADEMPTFAGRITGVGSGLVYVNVDFAAPWPSDRPVPKPTPTPVPTPDGNGYPSGPFADLAFALYRLTRG